ncbi:MAG: site-specific integrase [Draconibacterium sp.]
MNASISIVCFKSKTLANGENPLMLQVSKDGKRKYKSLGISVNQNHWDFKKNRPKPTCPDGEYIQQIILNKTSELQKQVLNFGAEEKDFTVGNLLNGRKQKVIESKVGEFFKLLINEYEISGKLGNRRAHKGTLNSIKTFTKGNLNFTFSDIDVDWLIKYEKWQRSRNNKETSMGVRFRTLRSVYNKAIKANLANKKNYPFNEFKVSKFSKQTKKRAISKADILKILNLNLSQENESVQFSRDIFIFSYLCGGINFTDIANLKPENVETDKLNYCRQKTGKRISLIIPHAAIDLINRYRISRRSDNYLFPILDIDKHRTPIQQENRKHKIMIKVNKDLKLISELAEIDFNLSTYVARHSFATVLKNSGVNIALISEALGHSELSTTQIYLDSFENKQFNEAMKHLL